jgi:hypothetical protein
MTDRQLSRAPKNVDGLTAERRDFHLSGVFHG